MGGDRAYLCTVTLGHIKKVDVMAGLDVMVALRGHFSQVSKTFSGF